MVENVWLDTECGLWLQLVMVWPLLELVSALTFDGKDGAEPSLVRRALSSRMSQELGRVSYALYLLHEPLRQYLGFALYGPLSVPHCDSVSVINTGCRQQMFGCDWYDIESKHFSVGDMDAHTACDEQWSAYYDALLLPLWCVPILWVASILVALLMNRFVEEPMRKWLRPKRFQNMTTIRAASATA